MMFKLLLGWFFLPLKLLLIRETKRAIVIYVYWLIGLTILYIIITKQNYDITNFNLNKIHVPLYVFLITATYLNSITWWLYTDSLCWQFRQACEHLRLITAKERYPTVTKITNNYFTINARAFKLSDFEDKKAELSSYLKVYIREIRPNKKIGFLNLYYSKIDLPDNVPFQANLNFGELILGYGSGGIHKEQLYKLIHIGIAGLPGSGKSVMLRSLITQTLINYDKAVIVGIDFKQGSEFHIFENSINFILCDDHETSAIVLSEVFEEYKRRAAYIKSQNADNSYQLTNQYNQRINPILIIIDEAFEFFAKVKSKDYEQSTTHINKLSRLARFVGIHLIIATQRPDVDAIPAQIRSMLKTRICFRLRQKEDSIMFIGTADATSIKDMPGRFLLATDDGTFAEMQALWLSKPQAKALVHQATIGREPAQLYQKLISTESV